MSTLTEQEKKVCETLKDNPLLTYRGIGDCLGISRHTVNNHLRSVYNKTGINNKTALVLNMYQADNRKI